MTAAKAKRARAVAEKLSRNLEKAAKYVSGDRPGGIVIHLVGWPLCTINDLRLLAEFAAEKEKPALIRSPKMGKP